MCINLQMLLSFASVKHPAIFTSGVHSRTILDGPQALMSSLLQATGLCTNFVGAMRDLHHVAYSSAVSGDIHIIPLLSLAVVDLARYSPYWHCADSACHPAVIPLLLPLRITALCPIASLLL